MGAPAPSTAFNDSWRGYNILEGRGIYARFDLPDPPQVTAPNPPSDWIAYTPTAIPGGYSCLELTGVHFKDHNQWGTPYNDAFGIWDWCNQMKFVYSANTTNYSFRDPYTRFYTDEQGQSRRAYWVQAFAHTPTSALHSSDCWEADIYNFNEGRWEEKWTSCGVSQGPGPGGWVMHETLHLAGTVNGTCYAQKSVAAGNLQTYLLDSSTGISYWIGINSLSPFTGLPLKSTLSVGEQTCWTSGQWSLFEDFGVWRAVTPAWNW